MPITINGLTGISGADGSAATPFITGSDTDTGLYFPSAGNAAISINGTRALLVDNSNNVTMTGNVTATEFRFANGTSVLSAAAGNPTGTVLNYASTTAPTGYLACDGSIYSRSTYGALANVIGTPPMLSSYTAEYSNANAQWVSGQIAVANGVAFITNANPVITTVNPQGQYSGGLYTSADGSTWTPRTARSFYFNTFVINGAIVANTTGGVWIVANTLAPAIGQYNSAYTQTNPFVATMFQTSTDLVTWTNRTMSMGGTQTGVQTSLNGQAATTYPTLFHGIAGGGTSNRLVALFNRWSYSCCYSGNYIANTATSDDGGVNWSFTNNIPIANSTYYPVIASSNGGFVITRGTTAYWSYSGQTWQDITANLALALGISATANVVNTFSLFYSVYQANNQFIIPAYGNKFLVSSPSGNGSNGNWTAVGPVEGIPYSNMVNNPGYAGTLTAPVMNQFTSFQNPSSATTATQRIVHNGQCFVMNYDSQILFSQDLKYWFKKNDMNYSQYGNGANLAALGNKFLLNIYSNKTLVSFTANGAYTAATQFPAPRYSQVASWSHSIEGGPAIPAVAYIKT